MPGCASPNCRRAGRHLPGLDGCPARARLCAIHWRKRGPDVQLGIQGLRTATKKLAGGKVACYA